MTMKGIDVSGYQGDIDFKKVKTSGIQFVIVKAGYSASTVDSFEKNYNNAKAAGLHVGAYWYSYAQTLAEGKAEAQAFIKAVKGKQFDFPLYLDLEENSQFKKGKKFCSDLTTVFCSELEKNGLFAGLYASVSPLETYVSEEVRKKYTVWCADYRGKCYYKGDYGIWQSGQGKVSGIKGDCDIDTSYFDFPSIIINGGFNGYPKKTVMPAATVSYLKLSEIVPALNAEITTIFREKGTCWSSGWHNGIDIAAPSGTVIKAAADGRVVNADSVSANKDGFGNRVVIRHSDGKATVYAHMVSKPLVNVGQSVKKGQIIGNVGSTGLSTGAHLHFTLLENWDKKPNIYYSGDLLDPVKELGLGTLKPKGSAVSTSPSFKVGDTVSFTGSTHYTSATGTRGTACKPGKANITRIANGAHPYHLVNVNGGGSTVYGWVNAADVRAVTKSLDEIAKEVVRGDWGNGDARKQRLTAAGYDYTAVQKRVEELMK